MKYEIRIFKKKTIKAQYKMLQVKIRIWNKILNNSVKMSKQFTHEKKIMKNTLLWKQDS